MILNQDYKENLSNLMIYLIRIVKKVSGCGVLRYNNEY